MARDRTDLLFERFRTRGDPAALAAVFDRTAPELLRIACYLSGNREVAEDLVQDTYLKAIEARETFDDSRPVVPWLIGILGNRVRSWRRDSRRQSTPAEDSRIGGPDPVQAAIDEEWRATLAAALEATPEPYRQVLVLHLVHGLTAKEAASALGRSAGTVRTQIVRGLESLRRRLPGGVVSGAVVLAWSMGSLAAMRSQLLSQVGGPVALPVVLGGWFMNKKLAGVLVFLCLSLGTLWWAPWSEPWTGTPTESTGVMAAAAETRQERVPEIPIDPAAQEARAPVVVSGAVLTVQVVWDDRVPLPRCEVSLSLGGPGFPALGTRTAVTDETGRCQFADLPSGAAFLRVDQNCQQLALVAGEEHRAEVELTRRATLRGRVLDPDDNPVAGVTVSCLIGYAPGSAQRVETDGLGEFRLRTNQERAWLWAAKRGYQTSPRLGVPTLVGEEVEVVLRLGGRGREVSGIVVDDTGRPVSGAWVVVGSRYAATTMSKAGVSSTAPPGVRRRTGADGRFAASGFGPDPVFLQAAAPGLAPYWGTVPAGEEQVRVALQPGAVLRGRVRDPQGVGVRAWVSWVRPEGLAIDSILFRQAFSAADGSFVLAGMPLGTQECRVKAGRAAELGAALEFRAGAETEWHPVVGAGPSVFGRVVDESDAPVAGVSIEAIHDSILVSKRHATSSDSEGRFRIASVAPGEYTLRVSKVVSGVGSTRTLLVHHGVRPDQAVEIRLGREQRCDGRIHGRVTWSDGRPPTHARFWFRDDRSPESMTSQPLVAGRFAIEALTRGGYTVYCQDRNEPMWRLGWVDLAAGESRDLGLLTRAQPGHLVVRSSGRFSVLFVDGRDRSQGEPGAKIALDPGRYLVRMEDRFLPVQIESGKTTELDLHAAAFQAWRFEFRAVAGRRLGKVTAEILDEDDKLVAYATPASSNDRPRWSVRLAPGRYRLRARAASGLTTTIPLPDQTEGDDEPLVFRLR